MFDKRDYIVEISKLSMGKNHSQLLIDKKLFEEFDCQEALDIDVKLDMDIQKSERLIEINFDFKGVMQLECGRCLGSIDMKVDKKSNLYIKFSDSFDKEDPEQWFLPEGENEIDLLNYIYEELRVEIPIAPMHKSEADCDKEMINRLRDNNLQGQKDKEIDPRWEKLMELKTKK